MVMQGYGDDREYGFSEFTVAVRDMVMTTLW